MQQPSEIPQQPLLLRQRQLEENDDENANANDDNTNTDDNDSSNNNMYSYQSNYWRRYDDQYFRDDDTADATEDDDDDSMYGTRASNNQNQDHQQSSSSSSANKNSHHHFYHGFYVLHASLALVCVFVGAIASGLYIGLLSLDPLLLVIKSRNTSAPQAERDRANHLLVLVTQERHPLIVTLLLINCLAAEAMPIFLQPMVQHSAVAIILSVLLVLVFGEILPSLLCTGVDQLVIASRLAPIVRGLMMLMYPIVMPIAYLMEALSNYASSASPLSKSASGVSGASSSEDDPYSSNLSNGGGGYGYACGGGHRPRIGYTRGELAVLIRVQHEERRALREQRRATMQQSSLSSLNEMDLSISNSLTQTLTMTGSTSLRSLRGGGRGYHRQVSAASIDSVDVNIMEGALSLKTRTAMDVFLGYHKVFCVPNDMVLDESNIFTIYASGYSRVPVYEDNNRRRIKGILMTRQLMVVKRANQTFSRRNSTGSDKNASNKSLSMTPAPPQLSDLTLYTPKCVAPETTLAEMINMFQKPKAGHMALVCARPSVGKEALESGFALPERAGLMG